MTLPPIDSILKTIPSIFQSQENLSKFSPPRNLDSLNMAATPSLVMKIWDGIIEYFHKIWDSISRCLGIKTQTFTSSLGLHSPRVIDLSQHRQRIINPNKLFVYNQLTQGRSVGNQVTVRKFGLQDPRSLESRPLFNPTKPQVICVNGPFRYDVSTSDTIHWTANFADKLLFGFCEGSLLAEDELQVLEHPALAHIADALSPDERTLHPLEVALFQNVPRLGALDAFTPLGLFPNSPTLYGNYFASATQAQILTRLTRFDNPVASNIFAIEAPRIHPILKDQPYQRSDLEKLFFTFYNAARGVKEICAGKKVVLHSGNWGAGAFGNDPKTVHLVQLAAARCAGVDELRMYPFTQQNAHREAKELLHQIKYQFPQMTVGGFLDHLTANAVRYGLRYKEGNGT
jgi:hypothetical protein